jgi:hypothetical protein
LADFQYLIIVGTPKSGTTSLFRYLSDHPGICAANRKETYFFARQFDYRNACTYAETLDDFNKYFAHCPEPDRLRLEGTPYTLYAKDAAKKISAMLGSATIMVILRDPLQRLVSDYFFHIQREHPSIKKGFEYFIDWQLNMKGDIPNLIEMGCYMKYLEPFYEAFGQQRVLVVFFEEFVRDTRSQLQTLCRQVGIDPGFYSDYNFDKYNQTVNVRYHWLNSLTIKIEPMIANARARLMGNPGAHRIFERVLSMGKSAYRLINDRGSGHKATIPPDQLVRWEAYYKPYNEMLADRLQRPLPWKSSRASHSVEAGPVS